ncbi:MAG: hypothetical protein VYC34_12320, partial [Planctomycetota bacterium]|nr:hypothetical protein [Planctomycetota bacterium]
WVLWAREKPTGRTDRWRLAFAVGLFSFLVVTSLALSGVITEPEEVASILMKTRDEEGESMAGRFRSLLSAFERDPSITGEDVEHIDVPSSRPRRRPFGDLFDRNRSTEPASFEPEPSDDDRAVASLRSRLDSLRSLTG